MNTFYQFAGQIRLASIIALFIGVIGFPAIHASEFNVVPSTADETALTLMYNTPRVSDVESHWGEFIASLNWADYVVDSTIEATSEAYHIAQSYMTNTPRMSDVESHWGEFIASLNWADYAQSNIVYFVRGCGHAC